MRSLHVAIIIFAAEEQIMRRFRGQLAFNSIVYANVCSCPATTRGEHSVTSGGPSCVHRRSAVWVLISLKAWATQLFARVIPSLIELNFKSFRFEYKVDKLP